MNVAAVVVGCVVYLIEEYELGFRFGEKWIACRAAEARKTIGSLAGVSLGRVEYVEVSIGLIIWMKCQP